MQTQGQRSTWRRRSSRGRWSDKWTWTCRRIACSHRTRSSGCRSGSALWCPWATWCSPVHSRTWSDPTSTRAEPPCCTDFWEKSKFTKSSKPTRDWKGRAYYPRRSMTMGFLSCSWLRWQWFHLAAFLTSLESCSFFFLVLTISSRLGIVPVDQRKECLVSCWAKN